VVVPAEGYAAEERGDEWGDERRVTALPVPIATPEAEAAGVAAQPVLATREAGQEMLVLTTSDEPSAAASSAAASSAESAHAAPGAATEAQPDEAGGVAGLLSLYQGLPGALFKEGPPSALYLGVYEAVKVRLLASPSLGMYPILVYLIAGAMGETIGSVVRAPAENVKARVQSGADATTIAAAQHVLLTEEGRANAVRAWSASLIRDVPFGAIQLAIFEGLKSFLIESSAIDSAAVDSLASEAILGAIGGAIGALLTVPPDVITVRVLTQDVSQGQEPIGALEMARRVWAEEGFMGFWTGWQARAGYWAPAIGIFLSCYCSVRQLAASQGLFS